MEFIVYEMEYDKNAQEQSKISCIPFDANYIRQYMERYNACFHEMRKALQIQPYDFLNDFEQLAGKTKDIFLFIIEGELVGSVACYGNEIDDLIVNKKYQHRGHGRQLLYWAMRHIRQRSEEPITLHVADWNQNALALYRSVGFEIVKTETIVRELGA